MAKETYQGSGASAQAALENLGKQAGRPAYLAGDVTYVVKLKSAKSSPSEMYEVAFAAALKSAGIDPDKFDHEKHKLEVIATGTFKAKAKKGQPSGAAPSLGTSDSLTDLF